jgi:F1F0 ATPase subunit 2
MALGIQRGRGDARQREETMTEVFGIFLKLTAGLSLGAIFYGGLWWTIRAMPGRFRGAWFVGSFLLRTLLVLAGFYGVARGDWHGLLGCMIGFLTGRVIVTRFIRVAPESTTPVVRREFS